MDKYQFIEVVDEGLFCILKFNRPNKRNAMHHEMRVELLDFLENYSTKFQSIVITGEGTAFSAGKDLSEENFEASAAEFMKAVEAIYHCHAITIAAVNGAARGGGLMIVNACDLAIASEQASFGMPDISEEGHKAFQDPNVKALLAENAKSYLPFAGQRLSAAEALNLHLVNRIVQGDQLIKSCTAICKRINEAKGIEFIQLKQSCKQRRFNNKLRSKETALSKYLLSINL